MVAVAKEFAGQTQAVGTAELAQSATRGLQPAQDVLGNVPERKRNASAIDASAALAAATRSSVSSLVDAGTLLRAAAAQVGADRIPSVPSAAVLAAVRSGATLLQEVSQVPGPAAQVQQLAQLGSAAGARSPEELTPRAKEFHASREALLALSSANIVRARTEAAANPEISTCRSGVIEARTAPSALTATQLLSQGIVYMPEAGYFATRSKVPEGSALSGPAQALIRVPKDGWYQVAPDQENPRQLVLRVGQVGAENVERVTEYHVRGDPSGVASIVGKPTSYQQSAGKLVLQDFEVASKVPALQPIAADYAALRNQIRDLPAGSLLEGTNALFRRQADGSVFFQLKAYPEQWQETSGKLANAWYSVKPEERAYYYLERSQQFVAHPGVIAPWTADLPRPANHSPALGARIKAGVNQILDAGAAVDPNKITFSVFPGAPSVSGTSGLRSLSPHDRRAQGFTEDPGALYVEVPNVGGGVSFSLSGPVPENKGDVNRLVRELQKGPEEYRLLRGLYKRVLGE